MVITPMEGRDRAHALLHVDVFEAPLTSGEARSLQPHCVVSCHDSDVQRGSEHHPRQSAASDFHHFSSEPLHHRREHGGRKKFNGLLPIDTLDVMRESARLLRRHSDLLTTLAILLVVPVSVIVLTHSLVTHVVTDWLAIRIEVAVLDQSAAEFHTPYMKVIYQKLAEYLATAVVYIPLAITLSALSKAAVVYIVASTYAGIKLGFIEILQRVVPRVWVRLMITYIASCIIFLASGVAAIVTLGMLNGAFAALHVSPSGAFVLLASLGLFCCGFFVYVKILLNVANVASVLEDLYGFAAIVRSFSLVRSRLKVAVWSFLVTGLLGGSIGLLFEYRVAATNTYTEYNASAAWEGPLLVLMHSFVYLFDEIMVSVLYFTCPTCSLLENIERKLEGVDMLISVGS